MNTWSSVTLADGKVIFGSIAFGFATVHFGKTGPGGVNRELVDIAKAAIKAGYRHLDGAEKYLTEKSEGVVIRTCGVPRNELFVTSKLSLPESAKDVEATLRRQLDDLQTDYMDLYLLHSPLLGDIATMWKQMVDIKKLGLARSIGVSNFRLRHLKELLATCSEKPVVNQIEIHPYVIEDTQELIDFCLAECIKPAAYTSSAPIARFPGGPVDAVVERVARELSTASGKSVNSHQVLLKWAHAKGAVVVTTTSNIERIEEQLSTGALPDLSAEQVQAIHAAGIEGGIKRKYMHEVI